MENMNFVGRTWGSLTEQQQNALLGMANAIDGRTCNGSDGGSCIVDFHDCNFSINGELIIGEDEDEITIQDDAMFYKSID